MDREEEQGIVRALRAFAYATIALHPDRAALLKAFRAMAAKEESLNDPNNASERDRAGLADEKRRIIRRLESHHGMTDD